VAIAVERPNSVPPYRTAEPSPSLRLQHLIDAGTVYVAQNLNSSQFATLQAIASRIFHRRNPKHLAAHLDATLAISSCHVPQPASQQPVAFDYQVGLDELDTIARTRTGYAFADLSPEIQEAILSLVASRDLTTRKLDLALWLESLHASAASL